jgi:HEAT repeat protein
MSLSLKPVRARKSGRSSNSSHSDLLSLLVSSDEESRKAARDKVLQLGPTMVPFLIKASRSTDENLRWEAVDALGSIRDLRATAAVVERVVEDDDVHVRWRSIWAITNLDDGSVVSTLLKFLKSKNKTVAWNAAVALSVFNRPEAVPTLLKGVKSENAFQRWEAVSCLGSVPNDEAIPALISVLKRETTDIRCEAALSLGRTSHKSARRALLAALARDKEPQVRWRAAMALARIAEPNTIPQLQTLMKNEGDPMVKEHIEETIRQIKATFPDLR